MELVTRLISDIEAATPAILSLRFNMDAGADPASEAPRKKWIMTEFVSYA